MANKFYRFLGKTKLFWKRYGADIMAVAGVAAMGTGAVVACVKTKKAIEIVDDAKENLKAIEEIHEAGEMIVTEDDTSVVVKYDDAAYKKDVAICYLKTAGALAKTYAIPMTLEVGGAILSLKGYHTTKKNMLSASAAAAGFAAKLDSLYKGIKDKYGDDAATELYYGAKKVKDETVAKDENGKEKKVKSDNYAIESAEDLGPYSVFYDKSCNCWTDSAQYNRKVLFDLQSWANDKLQREGHLFVNEIYEAIGIEDTPMGQIGGWLYDGEKYFDNIDFGLLEPINRRFVQFLEPVAVVCLRPRPDIVNNI